MIMYCTYLMYIGNAHKGLKRPDRALVGGGVVRLERAPFDLLVVRRFQGIELLSQLTCSGMIVILSEKYTD